MVYEIPLRQLIDDGKPPAVRKEERQSERMKTIGLSVRCLSVGALLVGLAQTVTANTVTVINTGTSPGVTLNVALPWIPYNGGAYVGVENLKVNGVPTKGFCIDLYHFSSGSSVLYSVDPLALSPSATPPGAMGTAKADFIKEMWAYDYANALTGNNQAAGFQLALWGILQGSISGGVVTPDWTWLGGGAATAATYDADDLIAWANGNSGPLANVVGLNAVGVASGPQAYAIPGVPDAGFTAMLLGLGLAGLGGVRRIMK